MILTQRICFLILLFTEMKKHVEKRENNLVENFEENHPFTKLIQILRKREGDMAIEHVRIQATNDVWKVLVDICLQASVNSNVWKKNYKGNELSSFVTPYDETFALLALENNYEDWIYLVLNDGKREKGKDLTLYNIRGKSKPDRNRKGYSLQGKKRFNAILKVVVEQRKDEESKRKEEWIKSFWSGDDDEGNEGSTEELEEPRGELDEIQEDFTPMNGFIDIVSV